MAALADVNSSALPPSESSKGKGKMDDEAEAEGAEKVVNTIAPPLPVK